MIPHEGESGQAGNSERDLCLAQKRSILGLAALTLSFLTMLGGIFFLILVADRPYGVQLSSIVIYTAAVTVYTFSRNRNNMQPFLLSCPVVRAQVPVLLRRHLGFLAALFIIQTSALKLRPNLPAGLITPRHSDPSFFAVILGALTACLALLQVLTNRSLLENAHSWQAQPDGSQSRLSQ